MTQEAFIAVLVGLAIVLVGVFLIIMTAHYTTKFTTWLDETKLDKWNRAEFPIPQAPNEFVKDNVRRGIHVVDSGKLKFTFETDKHESTRHYRYKSVAEALSKYEKDFNREQTLFVQRSQRDTEEALEEKASLNDKLNALATRADVLQSQLVTLLEKTGETK